MAPHVTQCDTRMTPSVTRCDTRCQHFLHRGDIQYQHFYTLHVSKSVSPHPTPVLVQRWKILVFDISSRWQWHSEHMTTVTDDSDSDTMTFYWPHNNYRWVFGNPWKSLYMFAKTLITMFFSFFLPQFCMQIYIWFEPLC